MKILLIYPQYVHHDASDARSPSLSLLTIAARLEKDGHQVKILDFSLGPITAGDNGYLYGVSREEADRRIRQESFDLAGITCSFASRWPFVQALALSLKQAAPRVPVAIGGLFPTYNWQACFEQSPAVDAIFLGESEETFARATLALQAGQSLDDACRPIDGVAWRSNAGIRSNPKQGYIADLDTLPAPAWHLLDLKDFFRRQTNFYELRPPYFTVLSSRGCPEACSFCNMYITHGRRWRPRSPKNFVDELEFMIRQHGVRHFFIADDNFSFDLDRAKTICREIVARKLDIRFNTGNGLNIKRIDKELLQLMKAAGCGSVALAIESGSERIRNEVYRKRLSTAQIFDAVRWCNEVGLPSIGFFMVGAPGENRESVEATKRLLKDLPLTLCTCSIYTPYPGTDLYDECRQKGYLEEINPADSRRVEFAVSMLRTPDFTPEQVVQWQREIYFSFIRHKWPDLLKQLFSPHGVISPGHLSILKRLLGSGARRGSGAAA